MTRSAFRAGEIAAMLVVGLAASGSLAAQPDERRILVTDVQRTPIPFALVTMQGGARRIANDSGFATLTRVASSDSLRLTVRRVGFAPFDGWVRAVEGVDWYTVALTPLASQLGTVTVTERADSPLARTGFYDRLARAQRGAFSARFITPEELDLRNPSRITDVLGGETFLRIVRQGGRPILSGRGGGCPVAVVVDGHRITNTVEDYYTHEGQREIKERGGSPKAIEEFLRERQTIDEIVGALSVAAIEVYASVNSAPVDIQRSVSADACGIVAVWTGARQ